MQVPCYLIEYTGFSDASDFLGSQAPLGLNDLRETDVYETAALKPGNSGYSKGAPPAERRARQDEMLQTDSVAQLAGAYGRDDQHVFYRSPLFHHHDY